MKKVIIPFKEHRELFCEEARQLLREAGFEVVGNDTGISMTAEMLKEMIVDADAAVAGVEPYSAEVLACAPNLKAIARFGVGTDNIDLEYCKEHGIGVARSANHNSVAEFALTLMLMVIKNMVAFDSAARRAGWDRFTMRELGGKKVGLVGFGKVGMQLARLVSAFQAEVLVYDPYISAAPEGMNVKIYDRLEDMLADADIVSLHLPATPATHHLFNADMFACMKDGAYLINTARGSIVDEDALYDTLTSGKLAGAGLDVYEEEPLTKNNRIIGLPNVVVTPHAAALSYETNYNGSLICARAIIDMCSGKAPANPVVWNH